MKRFLLLMAMVLVGITAEAQLVRSATLTVTREDLPPVELGWKHIIDAHIGGVDFDDALMGGVNYIAGYRLTQNLLAGIGTGIYFCDDGVVHHGYSGVSIDAPKVAIPLYFHGRFFFSTNEWAPYVGVSAGAYLAKKSDIYVNKYGVDEYGTTNWHDYLGREFITTGKSSSLFADLNIGLNHRLLNNLNNEWSVYAGLKLWSEQYYEINNLNEISNHSGTEFCIYLGTSFAF